MQNNKERIEAYIDSHSIEMVNLLKELVRIPSLAACVAQEECQLLMEKHLLKAGADIDKWIPDWESVKHVTYPNTGESIYQTVEESMLEYLDVREKVSVLCGKFGTNKENKTLMFNGHIDVAGLGDLKDWKYDPWGEEVDGRLYGRGTADQKAGVVASLYAVKAVLDSIPDLQGNVHLVITPEEETGGNGTAASIERGYRPDAIVYTDISDNKVIRSNSGIQKFSIDIHGNASDIWHENEGNAADILMLVLQRIRTMEKERNQRARKLYSFAEDETAASINTGFIRCGEWIASTPGSARIEGLMAVLPEDDLLELRKEFSDRITQETDNQWFNQNLPTVTFYPGKEGCITEEKEDIVTAMTSASTVFKEEEQIAHYGNVCSDMTYFMNMYETPSVLFGPGNVLHCPDEFVEIQDFIESAKVMALGIINYFECVN